MTETLLSWRMAICKVIMEEPFFTKKWRPSEIELVR
jgi:hypothetical protein